MIPNKLKEQQTPSQINSAQQVIQKILAKKLFYRIKNNIFKMLANPRPYIHKEFNTEFLCRWAIPQHSSHQLFANRTREPTKFTPAIWAFSGLHQLDQFPKNLGLGPEGGRKSGGQGITGGREQASFTGQQHCLTPLQSKLVISESHSLLLIPSAPFLLYHLQVLLSKSSELFSVNRWADHLAVSTTGNVSLKLSFS